MKKHIMPVLLITAVLASVLLLAYRFLEIYTKEVSVPPSREVRSNPYLALQRWLEQEGVQVRVLYNPLQETLLEADEQIIFIQAEYIPIEWYTASNAILAWIKGGKHLIVFAEHRESLEGITDATRFLTKTGLFINADLNESLPPPESSESADTPSLDSAFGITVTGDNSWALYSDENRAAYAGNSFGEGSVSVTGIPYFLQWENIVEPANSALAWTITGGHADSKKGILMVRMPAYQPSFFGRFAEQGNWLPLLISTAFLLILSFWAALFSFGIYPDKKRHSGRPIGDRLLAEARFLGRFDSLGIYLDEYRQIIREEIRKKSGKDISLEGLPRYLADQYGIQIPETSYIFTDLSRNRKVSVRDFIQTYYTIEHILEKL